MPTEVNLAAAMAAIEAATKKAERIGVPMNFAIVDAGFAWSLHPCEGAKLGSLGRRDQNGLAQ